MDTLSFALAPHHRTVQGMTLPAALDHAAETWGDRLALRFIEQPEQPDLSWSELQQAVARVRSGLAALGVEHGTKVATLLGNTIAFPLAWLAIASLGAVIVPLNPKYTRRELEFAIADSGAAWLIAEADAVAGLDLLGTDAPVALDHLIVSGDVPEGARSFDDLCAAAIVPHAGPVPDPDDLVNIQFTSGTTGLPKGCMLSHRYWMTIGVQSAALFDDPQRLLADHPFYYMQNQAYLAAALASGGALYVTNGLSRRKFMGWLVDHGIDYAWVDEGMLEFPASDLDRQHALRRVPIAAVPREMHVELESRFGFEAREWYASTEVGSTLFAPFDRPDMVGSGSMGLVVPGREAKIVDRELNEVADGVTGELCVRGEAMMLGYHNRPEVNSESFLDGGWFRTGDLARRDEAGWFYYTGRLKDMISRSGESIACAEVELQIGSMPEVDEVGVVGVPDADRGQEVKAIIVRAPGAQLSEHEVVAWARSGLSSFKIPRYVEFRSELPHTPSGKIAKATLAKEPPFSQQVVDVTGPDKASWSPAARSAEG